MKVKETIEYLRAHKANLRAGDLQQALESCGFRVREGKRGGHKIVSHPALKGFIGTNFNAGHGANSQVKPAYVLNMIKVLRKYEEELEQLIAERQT